MSKYNSKKIVIDGYTFDSKHEGLYYEVLKRKKAAGEIFNFELQPKFVLQEGFKKNGKTYRAITYTADFRVYTDENTSYCVDIKGMVTDVFAIKLKLFNARYDEELKLIVKNNKYGDSDGFIDYYKLKELRKMNKKKK